MPTLTSKTAASPSLPSRMVVVPTSKAASMNKVPSSQVVNGSMYEESFDLLSESHDYSDQYLPMAAPRYTFSSNGRDFKFNKTQAQQAPARTLSKLNVQHHQEPARIASSKNNHEPRPPALTNYPHNFTSHFTSKSHESLDLTDLSYGQMANSPPTALPSPVVPLVSKQGSTKLQRLKMDASEDWYIPRKRSCCPRYCCCFFVATFCVILGVALVIGSLYLAMKPEPPTLQMQDVTITSFQYSDPGPNGGPPQVVAGMKFFVALVNPNKYADLVYDATQIHLKYLGTSLGNISIKPFEEIKKQTKSITAELPPTTTTIQDPLDAMQLSADVSGFNVQTDLSGVVASQYKLWGFRLKKFHIPVDCKVNVKPAGGGGIPQLISSSCYNYPT